MADGQGRKPGALVYGLRPFVEGVVRKDHKLPIDPKLDDKDDAKNWREKNKIDERLKSEMEALREENKTAKITVTVKDGKGEFVPHMGRLLNEIVSYLQEDFLLPIESTQSANKRADAAEEKAAQAELRVAELEAQIAKLMEGKRKSA